MSKPLRCDVKTVLADWKTGKFSERRLAQKHGVSCSTIHKIVTGVDKEIEALVTESVAIKQRVAQLNEQEKSRYEQGVEDKLRQANFFVGANLLVANTVAQKVKLNGVNSSFQDLSAAANAISKTQEGVMGKQPETVVNNNVQATAQAAAVLPPPDVYEAIIRRVMSEL